MRARLRIVVADEDYATREYLQDLLEQYGHDVGAVGCLSALLDLCRDLEPDVVIAAMRMGNPDAAATARWINQERCTAFILLTEGDTANLGLSQTGDSGISCVPRPIKEPALREAIHRAAQWLDRAGALPKGA
jgi:CheY-like chemotaxis protein